VSIFKELRRRNVFKVGIAYAVTTWILLQLTDVISGIMVLPEWAPKLVLLLLIIGFVPALILAWAFELTPDGIMLEKDVIRKKSITPKTGRTLDYIIIVSLGLSLGYFIWESRFEQKTADHEAGVAAAAVAEKVEPAIDPPPPPAYLADAVVDKNSIAVLPFANRSADAEDIYFTDGIHDDLLTQLSRIDAFSVISRTSVMEYRDTTKNLRQIARELSVANVMEGSVQRAGERVRVNVQLIDANTDEHLWAEIYDRELTTNNLFDIQSDIAQAIATALKATLTESELASVANVPTENVEAYDLYLQARRFAQNESRSGYQTSIELLKESLALDSEFKYAWIDLAEAHMTNYWVYGGDLANRELALDSIEKARSLDADFAELYMAEGFYWYWGHLDYERALYKLDKAIEMMPGNSEAYMWRGYVSRRAGLWEQARESMRQALRLNPRVHFFWHEYATTNLYLHKYDEAENAANQARTLKPDSFWGKLSVARVAVQKNGDIQTAMQSLVGALHSDDYDVVEFYIRTQLLAQQFDKALETARTLSDILEVQRGWIILREDWAAQVLHFMGKREAARQAANAALFRLQGMRAAFGEDYRIDLAEARVRALQGASPEEVQELVQKSMSSMPTDELAAIRFRREYANIFAIAGMAPETISLLETNLSPPSGTSVFMIDLNPVFDDIRDDPDFISMMTRHR
jgi:TolB-like protein/Tfp pilus assembly protein PilF